jgi:hypothetical protein
MKEAAKRNWKTTLMGLAMLVSLGLDMAVKAQTHGVVPALLEALNNPATIALIGGGVGLIVAKDADQPGSAEK